MTSRQALADFNCSLARALDVVGDAWALLLLREAFMGATRFSEFQRSLGLARNILADRLQRLVEHGVLLRLGTPARPVYTLSERGSQLLPALVALQQWGDAWLAPKGAPVRVLDRAGREIAPLRLRDARGRALAADQLRFAPGPGADSRTRRRFTAGPGQA